MKVTRLKFLRMAGACLQMLPHKGKRMLANIKLVQNKLECLSLKGFQLSLLFCDFRLSLPFEWSMLRQGILTDGEGSVRLTSLLREVVL